MTCLPGGLKSIVPARCVISTQASPFTQRPVKVINGRIQWQPNPPPEVPTSEKPFSEKLEDAEKELARQREVNTMMNNDMNELINYLSEAGVI